MQVGAAGTVSNIRYTTVEMMLFFGVVLARVLKVLDLV
jgi:hypothetical protein